MVKKRLLISLVSLIITATIIYFLFLSTQPVNEPTPIKVDETLKGNYNPFITAQEEDELPTSVAYNEINNKISNETDYHTANSTYCYNSLKEDVQKLIYNKMVQVVYNVSDDKLEENLYYIDPINIETKEVDQADIRISLEAFTHDNPQIFWIANFFSYQINEESVYIQLYSHVTSSQINEYTNEIQKSITSIIQEMPKNMIEFDRQLYVHDKLVELCAYDDKTEDGNYAWTSYTIYGALVKGTAVCEGYTKALQILLEYVNIKSIPINGTFNNTLHQWNMVGIGGNWYHVDATVNDFGEHTFYHYFNLNDELIQKTHTINEDFYNLSYEQVCGSDDTDAILFNINAPIAQSLEDNFFQNKAISFTNNENLDKQNMQNALLNTLNNGENVFYIKVDENIDFINAIDILFYSEPRLFFDYAKYANANSDNDINLNNISIVRRDDLNVIEVYF